MFKPREVRHSVLIRARMRAGGPAADVCVRNVSSRGMLLQAHEVPEPGSYVEILLPDAVVVGRVMWAAERRFGIRARDRIPIHRLIGGHSRQSDSMAMAAQRGRPCATIAEARSDARLAGRSMQFLVLVLCSVAAAGLAALLVFRALSSVSDKISQHL
jgi:hypothetical protein